MDGITLLQAEPTPTLMLRCPTCASDAADTLGVTGSLDGSLDATVVMFCEACSTVYLSPVEVETAGSPPSIPVTALTLRRIDRWARDLPPAARMLCVDRGAAEHLRVLLQAAGQDWIIDGTDLDNRSCVASTTSRYHLILLPHSLESARDSNALLGQVANLLTEGGRIVVIVSNAGSSCFAAFGGRHWSGYQFPKTRQHFTPKALHTLGENSGLRVKELETLFALEPWLTSFANWLRDWGASNAAIRLFTGRWVVPQAVTSILEGIAAIRGRGSLLVAQLERK